MATLLQRSYIFEDPCQRRLDHGGGRALCGHHWRPGTAVGRRVHVHGPGGEARAPVPPVVHGLCPRFVGRLPGESTPHLSAPTALLSFARHLGTSSGAHCHISTSQVAVNLAIAVLGLSASRSGSEAQVRHPRGAVRVTTIDAASTAPSSTRSGPPDTPTNHLSTV